VLLEVKSHVYEQTNFMVSANEYEVMLATPTRHRYAIVLVQLLPRPCVNAIVFQPHLHMASLVAVKPHNYIMSLL
jgi:hypothetical protein